MGAERFTIENGLYGFKTDLRNQLREGEVPNWLYPSTPRTTADDRLSRDANPAAFFEACVEAAKGQNESYSHMNRDHAYSVFRVFWKDSTRLSGPSGTLQMSKPSVAPDKICDRIRNWLDENEERVYREYAYAEFRRGPRVRVTLGRRGGVQDIQLVMEYGN